MPKRRPLAIPCDRCTRRPRLTGLRYCIACRDYLMAKMRQARYIEDAPGDPRPVEFEDRSAPRGTNRPSARS